MKRLLLTGLLLMASVVGQGQVLAREEMLRFYEKALADYFAGAGPSGKPHLVLADSLPAGLNLNYPDFALKPVSEAEAVRLIERTSGKRGQLHKISFRSLSPDTLDLTIGSWTITVKKVFKFRRGHLVTKQINLAATCGGTLGYLPQARLIYNRRQQQWDYFSYQALVEEKLAKMAPREKK